MLRFNIVDQESLEAWEAFLGMQLNRLHVVVEPRFYRDHWQAINRIQLAGAERSLQRRIRYKAVQANG